MGYNPYVNYYAEKCTCCGKSLWFNLLTEIHEDEYHRGYCAKCFSRLAAPAKPDFTKAYNARLLMAKS